MYLVTGATGDLGQRVVKAICSRAEGVRAFVRLTSSYGSLEQLGAEIFVGDLQRQESIARSVQGVRYIISAHGSSAKDAFALEYQANVELIDAAKAQGVEHFVFISVLGVDHHYEESPIFKAKREIEKYLARSGLRYTILRPSGFASNLLALARTFERTGLYFLIGRPENRTSIVSTDDLSEIAVRACTLADARNHTFAIGGPEALRRDEIPKIFEKIFNKKGQLLTIPLEVFDGIRGFLGLLNGSLSKDLSTLRVLVANEYTCDPQPIENIFGIELESLHHFLRRNLQRS
jgi:uncharacterized protein YbjT (DUF2867 family)